MPLPSQARTAAVAVALLFLALAFQLIGATGHLVDPEAGATLKAYHLGILAVAAVVMLRGRIVRWPRELAAYVLGVALLASILGIIEGAQIILANAVVAIMALIGAATLGQCAGQEKTLRATRWGALLLLVAVLVKIVLYRDTLITFLVAPNGHPDIPAFAGGGPNLEATWVALGTALFLGTRGLLPYAALSALVSGAYASRAGLLATTLIVALGWLGMPPHTRRRWLMAAIGLFAVGVTALAAAQQVLPGAGYVIARFQSTGDDPGSLGRLALWRGGAEVYAEHPLGVGLGNAVPAVRAATMNDFAEDNLHNLYLQHLVELGLPGLALFGLFATMTVLRLRARAWRDPLLAYVVAYFALAFLQFRGWEPLPWFVYGLWLGTDERRLVGQDVHHGDVLMSAST